MGKMDGCKKNISSKIMAKEIAIDQIYLHCWS